MFFVVFKCWTVFIKLFMMECGAIEKIIFEFIIQLKRLLMDAEQFFNWNLVALFWLLKVRKYSLQWINYNNNIKWQFENK